MSCNKYTLIIGGISIGGICIYLLNKSTKKKSVFDKPLKDDIVKNIQLNAFKKTNVCSECDTNDLKQSLKNKPDIEQFKRDGAQITPNTKFPEDMSDINDNLRFVAELDEKSKNILADLDSLIESTDSDIQEESDSDEPLLESRSDYGESDPILLMALSNTQ